MREIKFRAWDKMEKIMSEVLEITFKDIIGGNCNGVVTEDYQGSLDRFELMQYTGLKDKNGKEIYEGDIVKAYDKTYKIVFRLGQFQFHNEKYKLGWRDVSNNAGDWRLSDEIWDNFEVIGNIYENSELLGGEL